MAHELITLRVSLDSKTYRDVEISGEASLYKLAEVINNVFGFDFDHAFGFYDNLKNPYRSKIAFELFADIGDPTVEGAKGVKKTKIVEAFAAGGKPLAFLFDYGDEWLFEIKRTGSRVQEAPKAFWKMIKSAGEAPEQYPAYEDEDEAGEVHMHPIPMPKKV